MAVIIVASANSKSLLLKPKSRGKFGFGISRTYRYRWMKSRMSGASVCGSSKPARVVLSACSENTKLRTVRFSCKTKCPFGTGIVVTGSCSELGDWNPKDGLQLQWHDDHLWFAEALIPTGSQLDFKFVKMLPDIGNVVEWQQCENIQLSVESNEEVAAGDIGKSVSDDEAFGTPTSIV